MMAIYQTLSLKSIRPTGKPSDSYINDYYYNIFLLKFRQKREKIEADLISLCFYYAISHHALPSSAIKRNF